MEFNFIEIRIDIYVTWTPCRWIPWLINLGFNTDNLKI